MDVILYEASETAFNTLGLGSLNCTRAEVTEELNGQYEIEFAVPIIDKHYPDILEYRIVTAPHDDTKEREPFVIYKRSAPINGVVTFYGHHIHYRLGGVTLRPYTAGSAAAALGGMETYAINPRGFSFWTDVTKTGSFEAATPAQCLKMLGGSEKSVLDIFGGEYEFNKFTVKLHARRGQDTDVNIVYGKNLKDITNDIDTADTYNAIVPFWKSSNGPLVTVPGYLVKRANMPANEVIDAVVIDMTSAFQEQPAPADLKAEAERRLANGSPWNPKQNIKVDFIALWQTEEYKSVAPLQRLTMGDTAVISYPALGVVNERQKVIKTVYDVLAERYSKIELGQRQASLGQAITAQTEEKLTDMATKSYMEQAIEYATQMITGGLGGYIKFTLNADGEPEELLIMDTPSTTTAINVWRFNKNGLGHSHNGYNGPFSDVALTADGRINANMITTGLLNANYIRGGTLKMGGGSNGNGIIEIYDASDNRIGRIDNTGAALTGDMTIQKTISSILYQTLIATVTARFWGETFSRGGVRISATSGAKTGSIVFTAAPGDGSAADKANRNFMHSNRPLHISAEDTTYGDGRWSSIIFEYGGVKLSAGRGNTGLQGVEVRYDDSARNSIRIEIGRYGELHMGGYVYTDLQGRSSYAPNVVNADGQLSLSTSSSERYKKYITDKIPEELDPDQLYKLPVKSYIYKAGHLSKTDINYGKKMIGFIAEDVDQLYPVACQYDPEGRPEMWNSQIMLPAMMKLIQEQKNQIDALQDQVLALIKTKTEG